MVLSFRALLAILGSPLAAASSRSTGSWRYPHAPVSASTPFPIPNGTSSCPPTSASGAGACRPSCWIAPPPGRELSWTSTPVQYNATTTITAATLVYVVGTDNGTTTKTSFNELPPGYTRPPETNVGGTVVTTLTWTGPSGGVETRVVAYPTQFIDYYGFFSWGGRLPTAAGTAPTCSETSDAAVTLASHPLLPQPTSQPAPVPQNTNGVGYSAVWVSTSVDWAETAIFSEQAAFSKCTFQLSTAQMSIAHESIMVTESIAISSSENPLVHTSALYVTITTTEFQQPIDFSWTKEPTSTSDRSQPLAPETQAEGSRPSSPTAAAPPETGAATRSKTSSSMNAGDWIATGLGWSPTSTAPAQYTSAARRARPGGWSLLAALLSLAMAWAV